MKIKRDGNLKSFLAAAELALVLDKKPLSAFVRDAKDGSWKEIADTLRLQSEQHVMVSHGEPTVRPGDSKKVSRLRWPLAPGTFARRISTSCWAITRR